MNTEILIGESIVAYIAGIKHGITHDKKIVSALEMDFIDVDIDKANEQRKKLKPRIHSLERIESTLVGLVSGIVGVGSTLNPQMFTEGALCGGFSFYAGLQTGRFVNKWKRDHAKLSQDEESHIDNIIENLRKCYKDDDNRYNELRDKFAEYSVGLVDEHGRSPKLFKQLREKWNGAVAPLREYREVRDFFNNTPEEAGSAMSIYKGERLVDAVIVHEDKLYTINIDQLNDEDPKMPEETAWNGTVDKAFNHVQDIANYHNVILVKGPNEMPLEVKLSMAKMYYQMRK